MPARRLPEAAEAGGARVRFTFDGRRYEGIEGEPVAVSLLAAGRLTLSRSFRFHRPRGLMCSTGECGWCECEVEGRPSVRTCRVRLRDGMAVRGEHAWPSVEHDLLRALDLGSRLVPPTFYHHRFLRPRRLRKAYLDVLRWFGGRGRLRRGMPMDWHVPRALQRDEADVLVVGGGRAGLLAAIGAADGGGRVVVLEADAEIDPDLRDLVTQARSLGVDVRLGTMATGWYGGMVTAMDDSSLWEIRAGAVISATGTYDLVPGVPGADRPGVMSARLVGRLLARDGVLPAERVILVGQGQESESVAVALAEAGARVIGPIATASLSGIGGRGPVSWVRYQDPQGARVTTRERVDLVVFGDRTPNLDLVLAAGAAVGWEDGRIDAQVAADGRTTVAGLFLVGDGRELSHRNGPSDQEVGRAAAAHARRTRENVASGEVGGGPTPTIRAGNPARSPARGLAPARGPAGAMVCFCEDVRGWEIEAELAAGYSDPELVKRRTGALTGPCQGKYCLVAVTCAMSGLEATDRDQTVVLPTGRPPLRPIRLGDLVVADGSIEPIAPTPAPDMVP